MNINLSDSGHMLPNSAFINEAVLEPRARLRHHIMYLCDVDDLYLSRSNTRYLSMRAKSRPQIPPWIRTLIAKPVFFTTSEYMPSNCSPFRGTVLIFGPKFAAVLLFLHSVPPFFTDFLGTNLFLNLTIFSY